MDPCEILIDILLFQLKKKKKENIMSIEKVPIRKMKIFFYLSLLMKKKIIFIKDFI